MPGAKDSTLPMALVSEPSSEEDDGCRVSCRAQGCVRGTHIHTFTGHFVCWGLSEDDVQCTALMCGTASCGGRQEGRKFSVWGGTGKLSQTNQQERL